MNVNDIVNVRLDRNGWPNKRGNPKEIKITEINPYNNDIIYTGLILGFKISNNKTREQSDIHITFFDSDIEK